MWINGQIRLRLIKQKNNIRQLIITKTLQKYYKNITFSIDICLKM